jgi:hypothetical protein
MTAAVLDFEFEPDAEFSEQFLQASDLLEILTRAVQEKTNRMICDLRIDVSKPEIVLWGRTRSYYYKQLASQAILTEQAELAELIGLPIVNEIQVLVSAR